MYQFDLSIFMRLFLQALAENKDKNDAQLAAKIELLNIDSLTAASYPCQSHGGYL